jgi:hypothetical protein
MNKAFVVCRKMFEIHMTAFVVSWITIAAINLLSLVSALMLNDVSVHAVVIFPQLSETLLN